MLFAALELQAVEFPVVAALREQFAVGTALDDLALLQHDDLIGVLNGREAVRHDQHRTDRAHLLKRLLDQDLGLGVDVRRRLVEDQDLGAVQNGAGKRQELPLSLREVLAALDDLRLVLVGQFLDKTVGADVTARLDDLLVGNGLVVETDVGLDRSAEQEHVLQHLSDRAAQRLDFDFGNILSVDLDRAALDLVVADDQL